MARRTDDQFWGRLATAGARAVFLLSLLTPGADAQTQAERARGAAPEVREVRLEGVENVDPRELSRSIATEASRCRSVFLLPICYFTRSPIFVQRRFLDRGELARDVLRLQVFYWLRGYREADVDAQVTQTDDETVSVTFAISENRPTTVRTLTVQYDSTVLPERARERLTLLRAGDPLNVLLVDSMRVLFREYLWEAGFGDARVDTAITVFPVAGTADVSFLLVPNRRTTVAAITISGTERVSHATILNTITLEPGGLFRRSRVLESQRSLYESGLFRLATVVVPSQEDSAKLVEITVNEAPLREWRVGAGLTNTEFLQFEGRFTGYNFLGGARRLDANAFVGNLMARQLAGRWMFRHLHQPGVDHPDIFFHPTWSASVDLRQPAFLRRPADAVALGAFGHRRMLPAIYVDEGYGASATFTRQFAQRAPGSANYRFEITRVEASDVFFCVNYGVCDTPTLDAMRLHQSLSPLSLTGFVDRTDSPLNPSRGYIARLDAEHASGLTLSDYRYNRAAGEVATYVRLGHPRQVLSGRIRLGFVRPLEPAVADVAVLHPRKRFYAGGANSVRGYPENQLGPRILTIPADTLVARGAVSLTGGPCDPATTDVRFCDPNTGTLRDANFAPQPLGGTSLVEGSVELRFPIWRQFDGAVFLDGALLGEQALRRFTDIENIARGTGALTPGLGIRYLSPVGPIRVDLGYNPVLRENLPVVTSVFENGEQTIVPLLVPRTFSPTGRTLLDRLQLHLSIGQAF